MSDRIPTTDKIRAMDGPALARLAFEMGLAPEGTKDSGNFFTCHDPYEIITIFWDPWKILAQADIVFHSLRDRGWKTVAVGGRDCGEVFAEWLSCGAPSHVSVRWNMAHEEALALLRCACLAVASEGAS